MVKTTATATEMKNHFGRYLSLVMEGQEVIITKNGQEVGRLIPRQATVSYLTDSLIGRLEDIYDPGKERMEELRKKYEITD